MDSRNYTIRHSKSSFYSSASSMEGTSKQQEKQILLMLTLVLKLRQKFWRIKFSTAKVMCSFTKMFENFQNFNKCSRLVYQCCAID